MFQSTKATLRAQTTTRKSPPCHNTPIRNGNGSFEGFFPVLLAEDGTETDTLFENKSFGAGDAVVEGNFPASVVLLAEPA